MSCESADIVIVGGGVIGLACAWMLAGRFSKVFLLDAGDLGGGASRVAQGNIGIAPWMTGFDLQWQCAGRGAFERFLGETDGLRVDRSGTLFVADDNAGAETMRRQVDRLNADGQHADWLDAATLREAEPMLSPDLAGAVHVRDSLSVEVGEFIDALIKHARLAGAHLFPREAVQSIVFDRGRIGVRSAVREIAAAQVVLAAGFETGALFRDLGLGVPIIPQKGHVLSVSLPMPAIHHYVVEGGYEGAVAAEPDSSCSYAIACTLQPVAGADIRIGSSREFTGADLRVRTEVVDAIRRRAARFLPSLEGTALDTIEVGLRPWTADNRPMIGPLIGMDGLTIASGHNGDGITTALATAARLADQLTGVPVVPMPEIAPERLVRAPPVRVTEMR